MSLHDAIKDDKPLRAFDSKDENGEIKTFGYTQNQRRLETKTKKYMKITEKVNTETKINNQTIKQIWATESKQMCFYKNSF